MDAEATETDGEPEQPEDVTPPPQGGRRDTLMSRFRKLACEASGPIALNRGQDGAWDFSAADLELAVRAELARITAIVAADPDSVKAEADPYTQIRVPDTALVSLEAYNRFLGTLRTRVVPSWDWEIRVSLRVDSATPFHVLVNVIFANQSSRQLSPTGKDHPHIEPFLFDTAAKFSFEDCVVHPFIISLAPEGFRYNRHLPAHGFNCAVNQVGAADYETIHAPVHEQRRYQTRSEPRALFSELAENPVPVLNAILNAMEQYRAEWDAARERYRRDIPQWEEKHAAEFNSDQEIFEQEIENFRRGRDVIRDNPDALLAFRLTNETFRRGPKMQSWRLFQIVCLVLQIPGICSLANLRESNADDLSKVDIIYFPTGGGKTEAYLAVLVFHCFFDRLRGKSAGVTSWIRFPLRLLTLQQTQRVADAICMAEIVRREQTDARLNSPRVAGFGVGYFVGKTSTPNELVNADTYQYAKGEQRVTWDRAKDDHARQDWRRLMYCPSCKTQTVRVILDVQHVRLNHICTRQGCRYPNGRIPIYVIDNEIYRYLPSVLVGTIDKLASIGIQRKMAQVLGAVDGICQTHGFYKGCCTQADCDNSRLQAPPPSGISGPTLFIQDELHLLKEGLGTFDGHYETFTREIMSKIRPGARQKIIASSATIENFARQVEHLYAVRPDQARRFPGQGPSLGRSFYAETLDYPQRRYIGLIPHNKTIFNAILELLEYYHTVIRELILRPAGTANPYGGIIAPGTGEWLALLDLYVTSTSYFLVNRDMNSIRTDLENHVSPILEHGSLAPIRIVEMTGSTTTDEVARSLEYLERPKPGEERATAVLATQMISHGVDIDRLNAMFFYGMPRQNAEYIQASSRVGRAHVGMVFLCHHPARERDQSHYALFDKFHQYLGQMIEPVAINRWAKFSINRTLPGLFMGILLQLLAYRGGGNKPGRYYRTEFIRREITAGRIRIDDFTAILEEAYDVLNANDPGRTGFREEIVLRIPQFFDQILAAQTKDWVSETLIPPPMTSLRNVDEPINLRLDRDGSQWAGRGGV